MGKLTVREIVLVSFPFSNLKGQKIRPALVLAKAEQSALILCQITSKPYSSKLAVRIDGKNFEQGQLPVISYVRPNKLFTADSSIIKRSVGKLNISTMKLILGSVRSLFTS